jgi:hypothetical protein
MVKEYYKIIKRNIFIKEIFNIIKKMEMGNILMKLLKINIKENSRIMRRTEEVFIHLEIGNIRVNF